MENLGQRLRRLRTSRNLSIEDMARQVGCATSTFRNWENGRAIQGEPYPKIAEVLGISLKELLTGEKPSSKKALLRLEQVKEGLARLESELLSLD